MPDLDLIFLAAALHGLFLVALLAFNNRPNRYANRFLAILVGLITIMLWNLFVRHSDTGNQWIAIDYKLWATPYLWMPMLYLYVLQATRNSEVTSRMIFTHSLPAILVALLQIPYFLIERNSPELMFINDIVFKAVATLLYLQMWVYLGLIIKELRSYQKWITQYFSATGKINFTWLRNLVVVFSAALFMDMINFVPSLYFDFKSSSLAYNLVLMAEASAIFAIGYLALRQGEVLAGVDREEIMQTTVGGKYEASPIDEHLGLELAEKLDMLMVKSKIFERNELRLDDLASEMKLSPHHLSQVINQHRNKNFYEYVNWYRAKSAADRLAKSGKMNLTKLAYDCGFNNRVSFNNAFKNLTGMTPSEFLRERDSMSKESEKQK